MPREMTDEEIAERSWRVPVWEMNFTILQHLRQIAYLRERFDALERCHDRMQQQYMHVVDLHARVLSECEQLWQTCLILQFHLNSTMLHTSAPAGESVPSGWRDREESEPTEACFGVFDEPNQRAEVAAHCEEAEVATNSTRPDPTTEVVVSRAEVADNIEFAKVAPTAVGPPNTPWC